MKILAIDPGTEASGVVMFSADTMRIAWAEASMPNDEVIRRVRDISHRDGHLIACECIEAMYAHVGKETVRTIRFTGRIEEAGGLLQPVTLLSPQEVKKRVCGTASAKDPAVRQALIDRLGPQGTKKNPGPTFGVSSHAWRALAVAVAAIIKPEP